MRAVCRVGRRLVVVVDFRTSPVAQFYAMKSLFKDRVVQDKQVDHVRNEKNLLASAACPYIVKL